LFLQFAVLYVVSVNNDLVRAFVKGKEKYEDIIEKIRSDIFVCDYCKDIGGTEIKEEVNGELKTKIIIVKEFRGIDYSPSSPDKLNTIV